MGETKSNLHKYLPAVKRLFTSLKKGHYFFFCHKERALLKIQDNKKKNPYHSIDDNVLNEHSSCLEVRYEGIFYDVWVAPSATCKGAKVDCCFSLYVRELTDAEQAAEVVIREILKTPPVQSKNPKVAFMFMTPGPLPFEKLWDLFFQGHEDRFTIYVHASKEAPAHVSRYFIGRNIRSEKVEWGRISMVDAERRLVSNALKDPDNQQFVLLSDSCIPIHNFDYVYNHLIFTNVSFIDSFEDPGPHGGGRYSEHMLPEVEKKYFRKGSQWFTMKRQHAILITADSLYYNKFRDYCRPGMEEGRNCYSDEHYLPTLFKMFDPRGIASYSVTYTDWSEMKWHPRLFRAHDVSFDLLKTMGSIQDSIHITSDEKRTVLTRPCMWNGMKRPCYLFARKFDPDSLDSLMQIFSNHTTI